MHPEELVSSRFTYFSGTSTYPLRQCLCLSGLVKSLLRGIHLHQASKPGQSPATAANRVSQSHSKASSEPSMPGYRVSGVFIARFISSSD